VPRTPSPSLSSTFPEADLDSSYGCRKLCHGLSSAPSRPADLAATVSKRRIITARCGLPLAYLALTRVLSWLALPARSGVLRANAIAERFIGTLRHECLDHLMITRPRHLAAVLQVRSRHYNVHQPHRSLRQHTPTVRPLRRDRLGGLVYENVQVACRDRVLGTRTHIPTDPGPPSAAASAPFWPRRSSGTAASVAASPRKTAKHERQSGCGLVRRCPRESGGSR
jgi:hypothetical protein